MLAGATAPVRAPKTVAGFLLMMVVSSEAFLGVPSRFSSPRAAAYSGDRGVVYSLFWQTYFDHNFMVPTGPTVEVECQDGPMTVPGGQDTWDSTMGSPTDALGAYSGCTQTGFQEKIYDWIIIHPDDSFDPQESWEHALFGYIKGGRKQGTFYGCFVPTLVYALGPLWLLHFLVDGLTASASPSERRIYLYPLSMNKLSITQQAASDLLVLLFISFTACVSFSLVIKLVGYLLHMACGLVFFAFMCEVTLKGYAGKTIILILMLLYLVSGAEAVVCMSCHDGIAGCQGGESCPFYSLPFINGEILRGASGTHTTQGEGDAGNTVHTLLLCAAVLPRTIARFFTRGVLDFFKSVARRPAVGTPLAVQDLSVEALVAAVQGGRVSPGEALSDILSRLTTATQAEAARLNAISSTLSNMEKLTGSAAASGTASNGELWGAFTYAWTQAGRTVQHANTAIVVAGGAPDDFEAGSTSTEIRAIRQAKILRPRSESEFFHMLNVWVMVCQAVGIGNALATGAFIETVVHEQIACFQLSWQQAHELFLVYLEAVETAPAGSTLTIANVYNSGGQDMYRERAIQRAKDHFKTATGGRDIFRTDQCTYIGQTSRGAPCVTFNLGKSNDQHPPTALDHTGRCKFAHKCDHFVTEQPDGTAGGICGSWKHCRANCTNAKKCDKKVTA